MRNRALALVLAAVTLGGGSVPRVANAQQPATRMHSEGLVAGGAVLTTIGVASLIGATYIFVNDLGQRGGDFRGLVSVVIGLPLASSAIGGLAGGIPMIAIGMKRIPIDPMTGQSFAPPIGGTLTWTF